MTGINNKAFYGKAGNQLRVRLAEDGIVRRAENCVCVSVPNKYKIEEIEPDVPVDQTIIALDVKASAARVPAFVPRGDDMRATVCYLLPFSMYEIYKPMIDTLVGKVYVDWEEDYFTWKANKDLAVYRNYTRESLEDMTTGELSELITEVEELTGRTVEISGTGSDGYILKDDKIDALLIFFGSGVENGA